MLSIVFGDAAWTPALGPLLAGCESDSGHPEAVFSPKPDSPASKSACAAALTAAFGQDCTSRRKLGMIWSGGLTFGSLYHDELTLALKAAAKRELNEGQGGFRGNPLTEILEPGRTVPSRWLLR